MVAENRPTGTGRKGRELKRSSRAEHVEDELKEVLTRAKDDVVDTLRGVRKKARSAVRNVTQTTQEVVEGLMGAAQEEAEEVYEQQKDRVVGRVKKVAKLTGQAAHALRAVKADDAAEWVDRASQRVAQTTQYLEDNNLSQMMEDASDIVRRHEAVVAGGLLLVGFALARFLKASASRNQDPGASKDSEDDDQTQYEDSAESDEDAGESDEDEDERSEENDEQYASSARNGSRGRHR